MIRALALLLLTTAPLLAATPRGTYRGTAQMTVKFRNPTTLAVIATRRYSRKVTVTIAAPKSNGAFIENNPFSLDVAPTKPGEDLIVGDFYTSSARSVTVQGVPVILQYWLLQTNASGFAGQFIDSHIQDGLARDRIVVPLGRPSGELKPHRFHDARFAQALQVTANAIVNDGQMTLAISGYGFVNDRSLISFSTTINATKR